MELDKPATPETNWASAPGWGIASRGLKHAYWSICLAILLVIFLPLIVAVALSGSPGTAVSILKLLPFGVAGVYVYYVSGVKKFSCVPEATEGKSLAVMSFWTLGAAVVITFATSVYFLIISDQEFAVYVLDGTHKLINLASNLAWMVGTVMLLLSVQKVGTYIMGKTDPQHVQHDKAKQATARARNALICLIILLVGTLLISVMSAGEEGSAGGAGIIGLAVFIAALGFIVSIAKSFLMLSESMAVIHEVSGSS